MKKSLLGIALISAIGIGFVGCVGSEPVPVTIYKPAKEDISLSNKIAGEISKGAIVLKDGSKIYDQEGDILGMFTINNELFYILEVKDRDLYKIKNSSQVLIREFEAHRLSWFIDENKIVICVKLVAERKIDLYDNVYSFDGKEFKIINKNLELSEGIYYQGHHTLDKSVFKSGMYYIESFVNKRGWLDTQAATSIETGKRLSSDDKKTNYKVDGSPIIIGVRNDVIYYIYNSGIFGTNQNFLEAFDMKANKAYTLYSDIGFDSDVQNKLQILKSGNQVVLKIFDNKSLEKEYVSTTGKDNHIETKYTNEPARIISLNTLKEVKEISNDFHPLPIFFNYQNLVIGHTNTMNITYTLSDILHAYDKRVREGNTTIPPMF